MYLLGYDIGSSSVKAALVHAASGATVGLAQYPSTEMEILAPEPDWAEQHPATWWDAVCRVTPLLLQSAGIASSEIAGIGIAYQMHGLVLVDHAGEVLRPAIIWCDSRAIAIGNEAFTALGRDYCLEHYLNSPGNFTASKLRWVRENEPAVFERIHKMMLPGDYIAYRMTGALRTTLAGLSEGILWDFKTGAVSQRLLDHYGIPTALLPELVPVFGQQGKLTAEAAQQLSLLSGIPVGYRAGDQPNNALSLNVLRPGEVAASGGTSGVVYAVTERPVFDPQMRVNSFAHINYSAQHPRTGVLLCINGAGIQYNWLRQHLGKDNSYSDLERLATAVAVGAEGLTLLPFGNGAERMLGNRSIGAQVHHLYFNRHTSAHFYRAALEGIAFAFVYGIDLLRQLGIPIQLLRAGSDNLFQSPLFSQTIANLIDSPIEIVETTGAVGAAKSAGVGVGVYVSLEEALQAVKTGRRYEPQKEKTAYAKAYAQWYAVLKQALSQ